MGNVYFCSIYLLSMILMLSFMLKLLCSQKHLSFFSEKLLMRLLEPAVWFNLFSALYLDFQKMYFCLKQLYQNNIIIMFAW